MPVIAAGTSAARPQAGVLGFHRIGIVSIGQRLALPASVPPLAAQHAQQQGHEVRPLLGIQPANSLDELPQEIIGVNQRRCAPIALIDYHRIDYHRARHSTIAARDPEAAVESVYHGAALLRQGLRHMWSCTKKETIAMVRCCERVCHTHV